jgi:hypothetical protein
MKTYMLARIRAQHFLRVAAAAFIDNPNLFTPLSRSLLLIGGEAADYDDNARETHEKCTKLGSLLSRVLSSSSS